MKIALLSPAKGLAAALSLFALSHHALRPAEISISNASVIEGDSGSTNAVFVVSLSETNAEIVTVSYATADETASAGLDYEAASGLITFPPGTTELSIMVTVYGDLLDEANETFRLNLANPTNATLAASQALGTIDDDDPAPQLSITDVTLTEGDSGTTNAVFAITLSAASGQTVTVQYATADGTASAGSDYASQSGILTFSPGITNQTVSVTVSGDGLNETNETLFVNLFNPVHAPVARSQGVGTINNDDPLPSLSIDDVAVIEGNSGMANAIFTVTLSAASGQIVTADYGTADGTATAGSDYVSASGSVSFQPGVTLQTITLVILGDIANELNETVLLNLTNPVHVTVARSQGVATIHNDDPLPTLSVSNVSLAEGNSGSTNMIFTVSLLPASGRTVTVDYATANGTAAAGVDYTASSGSLTFIAGTTNQTITVPITGDSVNESNETFLVNLSNPANATLAQGQSVGTILNDDPLPSLTITDVAVVEGNSGTTNAVFTLNLSAVSGQTLTVNFNTTNGTAIGGSDFVTNSGILTYPPGTTNRTIAVLVSGDLLNEADENFGVNLFNPVNVSLSRSQGVGTILNDDPTPSLAINDVAVKEGNSGTTNAVFSVNLSAASGLTVTVNYATADGTANAGNDYTAASGSLSFPSGITNQIITVAVKGETAFEADETFFVNLSNPAFATLARSQGIGTILDDEIRTNSFTNAANIRIANSGAATPYPSTIELSGLPGTISKVTVGLNGLSHTFPDDMDVLLVGPNGQKILLMSDAGGGNALNNVNLTFDDAASSLPDSSQINSGTFKPTDYTPGEFFPAPAPVGPYSGLLSVLNGANPNGTWALYVLDDTGGDSGTIANGWRLTVATTNVICCASGADADLSVTLTDSPDPVLTGNNLVYSLIVINNGPANATGVVLTNTLPAGVSFVSAISSQGSCTRTNNLVSCTLGNLGMGASATVNITVSPPVVGLVTNLASVKGNQTDTSPTNNTAAAVTTVNPSPPTISINDVSVAELNVVATNAVFTVSLSRTNNQTVTVNYATANGTASAGSDYTTSSGTLVFSPGTTNRTITVTVNGDALIEPNETFFVNLSSPANATIARSRGTGTIINDDALLGQLDHFNWSVIAPTQYLNTPFSATVTAVDPNNNLITNFAGSVALGGLVGSGASLSVLITEIDTDEDKIEISNVTGFGFDLSGWQVTVYDWLSWPDPALTFTLPPGTICGAGEVFLIRDGGTSPGAYPTFFTGSNIAWLNENTNNQVAVLLRNAAGQIIDFACAVDAFRTEISVPTSIPSTEWQGAPISANVDSSFTYQRTGNSDHSTAADWVLAQNSAGVRNSDLTVPFLGPRPVAISPTASGSFVNGSWTGSITVLELATNMYLRADDGSGHKGFSGEFTVNPTTDLALTNSGSPAVVSVGQNLTYTLVVTNHGPIDAAGVVVVDPLPDGVNYTSATTSQGTVTQSSNTVTINVGTLTSGTRATITISVTPTVPGMITNVASVTAATLDHNAANNSALAVIRVNFPPTISSIGDQTTYEDTPTSPSGFTIEDVETAPEALSLSGASSNTNLIAITNIVFGGSGMNRTVTLLPSLNQSGSATITISVSDGMDARSTNFLFTVNPVNDPPSFIKGANQTVLEDGGLQSVPGWATAIKSGPPDEAAQALTFVVTNNNGSLFSVQPAITPGGTLSFTPASNANGSATVTIQLRDNGGTANGGADISAPQSFTIAILPVNDAPSFTKGANQTLLEDAGPITVNSWATAISAGPPDESGQTLTFLVTNNNNAMFLSQPAISPGGALTFTTATNANGIATVTVRLQDSGGTGNGGADTSAPQTFTITVTGRNDPPVLTAIPDRIIAEGSTLIITNTATDPDVPNDILTYSLEPGSPAGVSLNATNGILSWTPSEVQGPSTNVIAVRVADNASPSLSDVKSFTVIVQEVNSAPVLPTIANQTISEGSLLSLPISATDGDIPANSLTYSLAPGAPMGVALNPTTGLLTWTPGEAQAPSTNVITVQATDNGTPSLSATRQFMIIVNEVNSPPMLGAISDQTVREGTLLSFTAVATDADVPVQTLTFSLDPGAPQGAVINPTSGVFNWTPTDAQGPSTNSLTVRVADNGSSSLSVAQTFTVIVTESNSSPELGVIGNRTVNEGALLMFTVTATDPDIPVQNLTFSLDSGAPNGASINPSNGVFRWTPTEAQGPSTNQVVIRVTDNGSPPAFATETINIIVNEVNSAPMLAGITNRTLSEGSTLLVTNSASDADLPTNSLSWSLAGGPSGAAINPVSGVLSWTPTEQQAPSTNVIMVRVSDNGTPSLSTTQSVTVVVTEVNSPPVLTAIANQIINEGSTLLVTNSATDADLPANNLIWSLDSGPNGATINPATGVLSWTPTEEQGPSTNMIVVRVSDNGNPNLSDIKSFMAVVQEVNTAPVLAPIGNRTFNEGSTLLVTNSATDADLPANNLIWSLDSGPNGMAIHPVSGVLSWTPTEEQGPSTNVIVVRVSDNGTPSLSDTKSFTLIISEVNSAPMLGLIPRQTIDEESLLTLPITATDSDVPQNVLTFALVSAPLGASIDPASGLFTWTPDESQGPTTNLITVRVTDDGTPSRSATNSFTVVVNEVNRAPVLAAIPDRSINEGNLLSFTITATDSDMPQNHLTYSLDSSAPDGASIDAASGVFTWVPSEAQGPSTNLIAVRVTDDGVSSLSDTKNVLVIVTEANRAPVLAPLADRSLDEGSLLTFTIDATDPDNPANSLAFTLVTAPGNATLHPGLGIFAWTPSEAQGPSTNVIVVRVSDDGTPSLTDTKSFTVVVREVNSAPVIAPIADRRVSEGSRLSFAITASDSDLPTNTIAFSLVTPPAGATIEPATGLFSWTPTQPGTNVLTVRVTDNGTPSLNATRDFTVVVVPQSRILELERVGDSVRLEFTTAVGQSYTIEYRDTLGPGPWSVLTTVAGTGGVVSVTDPNALGATRFYRVRID